jgi:hypothetical protein
MPEQMSDAMIDIVWRLSTSTLDNESEVRPLLERLAGGPLFGPLRYDLNQRAKWRKWDLDRAVVDTLTQRTQLVRIDGRIENMHEAGGGDEEAASADELADAIRGTRAVIATGKHDEQPTCMLRLALDHPRERRTAIHRLVDEWGSVCEEVPIDRMHITGPACRSWLLGLVDDKQMWPEQSVPAGYVVGWPAARPPREWDVRELNRMPSGDLHLTEDGGSRDGPMPVCAERDGVSLIWWVNPAADPPSDEAHGERVVDWVGRLARVEPMRGQSS